jgi:hypothetical protein
MEHAAHGAAPPQAEADAALVWQTESLFAQLWIRLAGDRKSKRAVRMACKRMRDLVDGAVAMLSAQSDDLGAALARWANITVLYAEVATPQSLAVLRTAPLPKLKKLTLRVVGEFVRHAMHPIHSEFNPLPRGEGERMPSCTRLCMHGRTPCVAMSPMRTPCVAPPHLLPQPQCSVHSA